MQLMSFTKYCCCVGVSYSLLSALFVLRFKGVYAGRRGYFVGLFLNLVADLEDLCSAFKK